MKVKKVFEQTHVMGKCAKQVVTIWHENVIYTVVCDKSQHKSTLTPKQLRVYWNEGKCEDDGWGQNYLTLIPIVPNDIVHVEKFALEALGAG